MTDMDSRPIQQQVVYAQDTQPTDERDGVMWVDTSVSSRPVSVYSSDTAAWEPVSPDVVHRQDTAPASPTDGDVWVDTNTQPREVYAYDGTNAEWDRVGYIPTWRFDGTINVAGVNSHQHTMSQNYDMVMVQVDYMEYNGTAGGNLTFYVNGHNASTDYSWRKTDGTSSTGVSTVNIGESVNAGSSITGVLTMTGRWPGNYTFSNGLMGHTSALWAEHGDCGGVVGPLDTFTFGGGAFDLTANVWGRNVA